MPRTITDQASPYDDGGASDTGAPTDNIHEWIAQLASITQTAGAAGITREVYTPEYEAASKTITAIMRRSGLDVRRDAVGNLFGRWMGTRPDAPRVLTGSHFDTTLDAGRLDGVFGVVGAIEALRLLRSRGYQPSRTIEVVGIAGEEPRFGIGCVGSRAMVGQLTRTELDGMFDRNGISLADAMRQSGYEPDRIADAALSPDEISAFVELHIEQGSVLEHEGISIGVVEHIAAPHDLRIALRGMPQHAGTTPMPLRRDAFAGAAEIVLAVERLASNSPSSTTVGTVGVAEVKPGAVNVIPGEAILDIDVRDSDISARSGVVEALIEYAHHIASTRLLEIEIETLAHDTPAACHERIVRATRSACERLNVTYRGMTSGAYHDAMVIGSMFPMGMIFVPSINGISHNPAEDTAPRDLETGVHVLAETLATLAGA